MQEWEEKAAEDKKRYQIEYQKWRNNGGGEAIRAHKKAYKKWLKSDTTEDNCARPEPEFEPMLIKPEPIGDDFKPKIELKKEEIAFERGIEETLNLKIKADPESTGNIQSKIKKKDLGLHNPVENVKQSKQIVQEIQSNKKIRMPKREKVVEKMKFSKPGSILDRRFKCSMCSERFSQRNDLNQRFRCDKCSAEEKNRLSKLKKSNDYNSRKLLGLPSRGDLFRYYSR